MKRTTLKLLLAFCALLCPALAYAQEGNFATILLSGGGIPLPGVKVAVCSTGLTTTAASVTNNIATLTMSSNPTTAGFLATKTLTVSGFTGADTYYNVTAPIVSVTATTISYALTHANAAAGTNGKAFQTGDATTACAPLVSLFTDDTGTVAAANPTTSDSIGNVSVWAAPFSYNVQYYGPNIVLKVIEMSIGVPGPSVATNTNNNFTSINTFQNLDNIRFVNATTAGADLGAKVNTADASLGANAGEIWIDSSAGTTWTTSTTFSGPRNVKFVNAGNYSIPLGNINSGNFPYLFDCGGRMQAVLNFTGGAGIAFNMNWAQFPTGSLNNWGSGLRRCTVNGPGGANGLGGNAGTGVSIGDVTHATIGAKLEDVQLGGGFALGYTITSIGSFGSQILYSTIRDNTQNFLINIATGGGMENVYIAHSFFQQAGSGIFMQASGFQIAGTGQIELTCESCSFDGDQLDLGGNAANTITFIRRHSEVLGNSATVPVLVKSGQISDFSPKTQWDGAATASATGIAVSGGTYTLRDGAWGAQVGAPVTQAVLQSGTGNVSAQNPLMIATNVGGLVPGGSGWFTSCDPNAATCTFLGANFTLDIAHGTSTLGNTIINAGACAATVTTAAPGTLTTNTVVWSYALLSAPTTNGVLTVNAWPTVGNVNFVVCNPTAGNITPSGLTLNWRVLNQ